MTRRFLPFAALLGAAIVGATAAQPVRADVTLPTLFGDSMVLQRGVPIPVWGKAAPGERVSVTLNETHTASVEAGADGRWRVALRPLPAGGPFTLSVKGRNQILLKDVLIGDVWLCSGQSNMGLTLQRASNAAEAIAASTDSGLRFFRVRQAASETPEDDVRGPASWQAAGPETAGGFSAVAYFFGRALRKAQGADGVPIGLIGAYVGGTPGQAWTREAVLTADPDLRRHYVEPYPAEKAQHDRQMAQYRAALTAAAKAAGTKAPRKPFSFWRYSSLYNGMIAPLTPFPIRGIVWYQGESNIKNPAGYRALLPAMIRDWQARWNAPGLPFLLVQLPPFGSSAGGGTAWAEVREIQQGAAQTIPGVGLAVTTDVGDRKDIHPTTKHLVGERLALLARKIAYRETALVASGPMFRSLKIDGGKAIVAFDNVGDGLEASDGESSGQPVSADNLTGFTIAGEEGKFVPATAKIVGRETVVVSAPSVAHPKAVRYGFVNFPVVNLWNKNGLPASPFRTDAPDMQEKAPAEPRIAAEEATAVYIPADKRHQGLSRFDLFPFTDRLRGDPDRYRAINPNYVKKEGGRYYFLLDARPDTPVFDENLKPAGTLPTVTGVPVDLSRTKAGRDKDGKPLRYVYVKEKGYVLRNSLTPAADVRTGKWFQFPLKDGAQHLLYDGTGILRGTLTARAVRLNYGQQKQINGESYYYAFSTSIIPEGSKDRKGASGWIKASAIQEGHDPQYSAEVVTKMQPPAATGAGFTAYEITGGDPQERMGSRDGKPLYRFGYADEAGRFIAYKVLPGVALDGRASIAATDYLKRSDDVINLGFNVAGVSNDTYRVSSTSNTSSAKRPLAFFRSADKDATAVIDLYYPKDATHDGMQSVGKMIFVYGYVEEGNGKRWGWIPLSALKQKAAKDGASTGNL